MEFPPVRSERLGVVTEKGNPEFRGNFNSYQRKKMKIRKREKITNQRNMGKNTFWSKTFCSP